MDGAVKDRLRRLSNGLLHRGMGPDQTAKLMNREAPGHCQRQLTDPLRGPAAT